MRVSFVLAFLALASALILSCETVLAANTTATPAATVEDLEDFKIDPGALEVGDSLISPGSSLYFLKALRERIEFMISTTPQVKAQRELEFSVRRLREVKSLIEERREDLIETTLERYKNHLNSLKGISGRDEGLAVALGESIARHTYILQTLYYQTSNQAAKRSIRASIGSVIRYNNNLIGSLEQDVLRKQFIDNVSLRQIAACQFLSKEVSSADLNQTEKVLLKEEADKCLESVEQNFQPQLQQIKDSK